MQLIEQLVLLKASSLTSQPKSPKNQKNPTPKKFLIFQEMGFSWSNIKKKNSDAFSKQIFSFIFGNGTLHLTDWDQKNKKKPTLKKIPSISGIPYISALILKIFLYSLKRKLFLYFRQWNPALFNPIAKNIQNLPWEKFLMLQEQKPWKKFLIFFSKESCSYVLGNGNSETPTLHFSL